MLVCPECKGTNVCSKAWVDSNTNQYIEDASDIHWCVDCEETYDKLELITPKI